MEVKENMVIIEVCTYNEILEDATRCEEAIENLKELENKVDEMKKLIMKERVNGFKLENTPLEHLTDINSYSFAFDDKDIIALWKYGITYDDAIYFIRNEKRLLNIERKKQEELKHD